LTNPKRVGIYFKCFYGANAHCGLTEDDSFSVEDVEGRRWICHPVKREDVATLEFFNDFRELEAAEGRIDAETEVRIVICETLDELPSKLAESIEKR
jgi:hypothetical protein